MDNLVQILEGFDECSACAAKRLRAMNGLGDAGDVATTGSLATIGSTVFFGAALIGIGYAFDRIRRRRFSRARYGTRR